MAVPRKFSEKIALHNQKQAEGTAEFEKVMREVSDVTNKPSLGCLDDQLKHSHPPSHTYRERPHSAVGVGPIRSHRPTEKRMDHSPYSGSYLSPPSNPWRRTHSDSSLHTSSHENNSHRRAVNECHTLMVDEYDSMKRGYSCSPEGRPRSALDMPRVPGISIYPSQQDPGANQIPIGSNTGSLPDLSSFHMASPLDVPLDNEDASSFLSNSRGGSPRSISPMQRNQRFIGSTPNEAPGPPPHQLNHVDRNTHHSAHSRPSPQMSPQLSIPYKYGSQSPSSSPQSPPSPSGSVCKMNPSLEQNNYYISQEQVTLQHHFEQFSMSEDNCTKIKPHELTHDLIPIYQCPRMPQEPSPTTPSSIPNITLTDFSNGEDFDKDYLPDLFPPEECLRGLVPIDIDGLQMLTDPTSLIADSATEDHLRHEGI